MTSVKEQYAELLALTRLFLLQEHAPNERLLADAECYRYFRDYAMQKAAAQPQNSAARPAPVPTPPQAPQAFPAPRPMPAQPPALASPPPAPPALAVPPAPVAHTVDTRPEDAPPPPPEPVAQSVLPEAPHSAAPKPAEAIAPSSPPSPPADAAPSPTPPPATAAPAVFVPDVPPAATPLDLKELHELVLMHLPGVPLLPAPPNDLVARQAARLWERENAIPAVAILCFEEQPKHKAFLTNIGRALEAYGLSATVIDAAKIEQEHAWPRLLEAPQARLVIAGGYGMYALPELMQHYREGEKSSGPRLGRLPLLLLSDVALYLKEPHLKPSLWKSLKDLLR